MKKIWERSEQIDYVERQEEEEEEEEDEDSGLRAEGGGARVAEELVEMHQWTRMETFLLDKRKWI
jgi:hypothetical protein